MKNTLFISIFAILLMSVLVSSNFGMKNPYKGKGLEKGKKIFMKNCAVCHSENGKGVEAIVKDLDLSSSKFQKQSDDVIFEKISEGKQGTTMRAYGDEFSKKNIWYLVNYIRTLKVENKTK